jgi:hypothetical protein
MVEKSAYSSPLTKQISNNLPMRKPLILLVLSIFCQPALAQDKYRVVFNDELSTVSVRACFDGDPPSRLYHSSEASNFTAGLETPTGRMRLRTDSDSSRLKSMSPDSCISWQVDLKQATNQSDARFAARIGDDLITNTDLWFWRGSSKRNVEIDVALPDGISISTPWQEVSRSDSGIRFLPAKTPAGWISRIAVGRFNVEKLKVADSEFRLAITGSLAEAQKQKLSRWMQQAANSVSGAHGTFPQASPQILVIPIGERSNPVPWAHVMRGGGVSAEFFVDETRPFKDLSEDWTACHELSHMLLPFVSRKDRWLSEGLASYYQYLLLARSGTLSEKDAWQGFYDGIKRGENGTPRGTSSNTLAEATLQGRGQTMRVYWSGAALMFLADTQLRAASNNEQSLDSALKSLQSCCLDGSKLWRADELFKRLDGLTGTRVFSTLYKEHVHSISFPDLSGTWEALGVRHRFNRVSFNDTAPQADIRKAIVTP